MQKLLVLLNSNDNEHLYTELQTAMSSVLLAAVYAANLRGIEQNVTQGSGLELH